MSDFIGRKFEYNRLSSFLRSKVASFIVVKGRRRVGKSALIEQFAQEFPRSYTFTGLAPDSKITAEDQRKEFCRQFAIQFSIPNPNYNDWGDIFWAIAERVKKGRVLLFLDEISWMAKDDATFLPKLKDAWDRFYKKNNKLIIVVCASASSWIDKNILSNTAFVGRVSFEMKLLPLPLDVCKEFWQFKDISAYEKLKVIAVTGGIPRYLEAIQPQLSAEENIKNLCFTAGGLLVNEFNKIFNDLFLHESHFYRSIVALLANGPKQFSEICKALSLPQSGRISGYLFELAQAGFIKRYYSWSIKTSLESKISVYRLTDNYLRFYFKYIEPNINKINENKFAISSLSNLSGWDGIIALQIENLVINNRELIIKSLEIFPEDIVADGPYFQRSTKQRAGCQIDYLIQTRHNNLFIVEVKFLKKSVKKSVIEEVTEKTNRLVVPKGFSIRKVLIHVNGVDAAVRDEQFFSHIIDMSDWLR